MKASGTAFAAVEKIEERPYQIGKGMAISILTILIMTRYYAADSAGISDVVLAER